MDVLERLSALAAATLRTHPELSVDTPDAQVALHAQIGAEVAAAEQVRTHAGGARAGIVLSRSASRQRPDAQRCRIEIALHDAEATRWVATQVRELAPQFDDDVELRLDVCHRALLPELERCGLVPRMQWFHGNPRTALEALRSGPRSPAALGDELRMEPLSQRYIEPLVALARDYFQRRPETGFLPPHLSVTPAMQARIDQFTRDRMTQAVGTNTALVVVRDGEAMGYGGYHPQRDPILGHFGGLALVLAEPIQGRGLSKLIYERLLQSMISEGVELMRGRTANPAVLHLAARMKRPLRGWQVEPARRT
jgi:GNAT superfamily N-acetyltransferase